jgi:hypothetical protein
MYDNIVNSMACQSSSLSRDQWIHGWDGSIWMLI